MDKYWDAPPDAEINFGKNILRYWKSAGKLQVLSTYTDKTDGVNKVAKTVALSLDSLRECPEAMELMRQIFADIA